jgi:hypothetical protein
MHHVAVDNRLTTEQLAALPPGDPVTIEIVHDFRRPKHVAGTLVGSSARRPSSPAAATAASRTCTTSTAAGSGSAAGDTRMVAAAAPEPVSAEQRHQAARVDAAYRDWTRNGDDVDRLRELREAIDECLNDRLMVAN